ncbi:hypothetical protein VTJ04DRAFT_2081 [Mycothermus thermophilus]|uniref:uncharacterized protein n=1 Tax=Humicola insolens TaxID=85995 RepID=UPI003744700D
MATHKDLHAYDCSGKVAYSTRREPGKPCPKCERGQKLQKIRHEAFSMREQYQADEAVAACEQTPSRAMPSLVLVHALFSKFCWGVVLATSFLLFHQCATQPGCPTGASSLRQQTGSLVCHGL